MSYKKIRVIKPDTVRNPENGYVYLGWGEVTAASFTGPWIKEADGTVSVISGGTGGGGVSYWTNPAAGYIAPLGGYDKLRIGGSTGTQYVNVDGAILIGTTSTNTAGSIRWTGTDFQGNTGGTATDWVSLTARAGTVGSTGVTYWYPNSQGIIYPDGKVYIGSSFSVGATNDILNVKGGITLQESSNSNAGTIHYYTSGSVDSTGFYGYTTAWKKLDVFDRDITSGAAYYEEPVVIGGQPSGGAYSDPMLMVSGNTQSHTFKSTHNELFTTDGFSTTPTGGFGGWSGKTGTPGTYKYGLSGTFTFQGYNSGGRIYKVDVVNGLIVGVTDEGAVPP